MPEHASPSSSRPAGLPDRFVAVRLSSLGDVALVTGVLHYWHETWGLRFRVLTRAPFASLFDNHPAVDGVIGLEDADLHGSRQRERFRALTLALTDAPLLDLHGTLRIRLLALGWRGKVHRYPKHALARRIFLLSKGRLGRNILLRETIPQRYLRALPLPGSMPAASLLGPRLFLKPEEEDRAASLLASTFPLFASGSSAPIALHPFATHTAKTWPLEYWLTFAAMLADLGLPYFWIGKSDQDPIGPHANNFINKTGLRQLAALLAHAQILVTGDSGPMHLASGVGTPVLALFGPTCREWGFFPSGEHDIILQSAMACRPCSLHGKQPCPRSGACLRDISPASALDALRRITSISHSAGGKTRR